MIQLTVKEFVWISAHRLTEAKRDLRFSLGVDRSLMSESRFAIDSSRALLRKIGREEAGYAVKPSPSRSART